MTSSIPNEYIVEGFPPRDKMKTKEAGQEMDVAGVRNIRSANDFLTRVSEPSVDTSRQIGFDLDAEHHEGPSRTA